MGIFNRNKKSKKRSWISIASSDEWDSLICSGYTSLAKCPEVVAGVRQFAQLISSMTIYLMSNTDSGDKRIINELSKKVDIYPNRKMTRRTWMDALVMNLILYGSGNSIVIPHTNDGLLGDLEIVEADRVRFPADRNDYRIFIDQAPYDPEQLLHFVYNPDEQCLWKGQGVTVALRDVADNLKQAMHTEKNFMQSKWKPSLIVKVDALTEEFASPAGRRKLLESYTGTAEAGDPWLIPAEQFSVEQVRPLSLADLAINDQVQLDKRTVASILGIPAFVLGVGDYTKDAWNAFVNNSIRPIAQEIEQELTRKLLVSPKMYWKFNIASLYSYDLQATSTVYSNLFQHGIVTGNEVRDKIGMEPMAELDELVILENYIPIAKVGDQNKLSGGINNE